MKDYAQVLIICPVFNEESNLPRLLDSLFAQSFKDWVAFFSDNASQDSSETILTDARKRDSRIRLQNNIEHLPVHQSFNRAFEQALGSTESRYVQIVAADDVYASNDSLGNLVHGSEIKSADICLGKIAHLLDSKVSHVDDFAEVTKTTSKSLFWFAQNQWAANMIYGLMSRNFFKVLIQHRIAGFTDNLASDWWFSWVAINEANSVCTLDTVVYSKYRRENGFSSPRPKKFLHQRLFAAIIQPFDRCSDRRKALGLRRYVFALSVLLLAEIRMGVRNLTNRSNWH